MGKTRRGKGTKIMAVADRFGLPFAVYGESASPHEVTIVEPTLQSCFTEASPERLIRDKAYDSDPLDQRLKERGIEMIAPHKANRIKSKSQDGRALRRYKRRWRIESLFAWLGNFRHIAVRFDYCFSDHLGFVQLGCIPILLRNYL